MTDHEERPCDHCNHTRTLQSVEHVTEGQMDLCDDCAWLYANMGWLQEEQL